MFMQGNPHIFTIVLKQSGFFTMGNKRWTALLKREKSYAGSQGGLVAAARKRCRRSIALLVPACCKSSAKVFLVLANQNQFR
jgi:hypothetical protein